MPVMGPKKTLTEVERAKQAEAFVALCVEVFGERDWRWMLTTALGYHYATIMRYQRGAIPVPPVLWVTLDLLKIVPRATWEPMLLKGAKPPPRGYHSHRVKRRKKNAKAS